MCFSYFYDFPFLNNYFPIKFDKVTIKNIFPSIMIGFLTELNTGRIPVLDELFLQKLEENHKVAIGLINYQDTEEDPRNIKIPTHIKELIKSMTLATNRKKTERCFQMILRFRYFCELFLKRKIAWLVRTTDDCFVNVNNIDSYINYLNTLGDPFTDVMVEGNCVGLFLQGGSGWTMSRKAAEKYLEFYTDSKVSQECLHLPDDCSITNYLKYVNVSLIQSTSHFFHGHGDYYIDFEQFDKNLEAGTLNKFLQQCPNEVAIKKISDKCDPFLEPIQNIVFLHFIGTSFYKKGPLNFSAHTKKVQIIWKINSTRVEFYQDCQTGSNRYCYNSQAKTEPLTIQQKYPSK